MRRIITLFAVLASGVAVLTAHPLGRSISDDRHEREHHGGRGDTVWVTNRDQGTLMVFDADTGEPKTLVPIQIGKGVGMGTHDLVVSRRTGKAFLMNETVNSVTVLSASTFELLDTIEDVGPLPHHTKLSQDGKTVYVGLFGTNMIAAINARTHRVRKFASSELAGPRAHAPRPSPDGRFVFVPHEQGTPANLVTMLHARSRRILRSLNPGDTPAGQPSEVLTTSDGETLFVSMRNEGKIKAYDVDTFAFKDDVSVGTQPESLILAHGERTLVVSLRGTPARLAFVNVEDCENLSLRGTLDIGGDGTFGDLAVASPDGRFIYATFDSTATGQGGVAKVDLSLGTVETWPYPGVGRPHGIAYSTTRLR